MSYTLTAQDELEFATQHAVDLVVAYAERQVRQSRDADVWRSLLERVSQDELAAVVEPRARLAANLTSAQRYVRAHHLG